MMPSLLRHTLALPMSLACSYAFWGGCTATETGFEPGQRVHESMVQIEVEGVTHYGQVYLGLGGEIRLRADTKAGPFDAEGFAPVGPDYLVGSIALDQVLIEGLTEGANLAYEQGGDSAEFSESFGLQRVSDLGQEYVAIASLDLELRNGSLGIAGDVSGAVSARLGPNDQEPVPVTSSVPLAFMVQGGPLQVLCAEGVLSYEIAPGAELACNRLAESGDCTDGPSIPDVSCPAQ